MKQLFLKSETQRARSLTCDVIQMYSRDKVAVTQKTVYMLTRHIYLYINELPVQSFNMQL